MNKLVRSIRGATLLEVMLVLAIAAMIIVMSVRYYQTATSNQQSNAAIAQVQSIAAAADQLAQASGSYQTGGVATATVTTLMPANGMTTPWGTAVTVTGATDSTYIITLPGTPPSVCPLVRSKVLANAHFTVPACTTSVADMVITYTSNV